MDGVCASGQDFEARSRGNAMARCQCEWEWECDDEEGLFCKVHTMLVDYELHREKFNRLLEVFFVSLMCK